MNDKLLDWALFAVLTGMACLIWLASFALLGFIVGDLRS